MDRTIAAGTNLALPNIIRAVSLPFGRTLNPNRTTVPCSPVISPCSPATAPGSPAIGNRSQISAPSSPAMPLLAITRLSRPVSMRRLSGRPPFQAAWSVVSAPIALPPLPRAVGGTLLRVEVAAVAEVVTVHPAAAAGASAAVRPFSLSRSGGAGYPERHFFELQAAEVLLEHRNDQKKFT